VDRRPSARPEAPAGERLGLGLGVELTRPGRMRKSSSPVTSVAARCENLSVSASFLERPTYARAPQGVAELGFAGLSAPTDRPHLAACILPSSVDWGRLTPFQHEPSPEDAKARRQASAITSAFLRRKSVSRTVFGRRGVLRGGRDRSIGRGEGSVSTGGADAAGSAPDMRWSNATNSAARRQAMRSTCATTVGEGAAEPPTIEPRRVM
jgi:hypothetical protein